MPSQLIHRIFICIVQRQITVLGISLQQTLALQISGQTVRDGVGDNEPARSTKIGHSEPCPCGSGRKYKKCCGAQLH